MRSNRHRTREPPKIDNSNGPPRLEPLPLLYKSSEPVSDGELCRRRLSKEGREQTRAGARRRARRNQTVGNAFFALDSRAKGEPQRRDFSALPLETFFLRRHEEAEPRFSPSVDGGMENATRTAAREDEKISWRKRARQERASKNESPQQMNTHRRRRKAAQ